MGNGGGGDGSLSVLSPSACRKRFSIEAIVQMRKVLGGGWDRKKVGASAALFSGVSRWDGRGAGGKAQYPALVQPHMPPPAALRLFSLPHVPLKDLLSLC